MFEIPDDDDEFWENLPLENNLMECKRHTSKSPFNSGNGHSAERSIPLDQNKKGMTLGISKQNIEQNFITNAFMNKSNLPKHSSASVSSNGQNADRFSLSKATDIFNLTQSSTESDLDLSLNSDCDSRKTNFADSSDRLTANNRLDDSFPTTFGPHSAKGFVQNNQAEKTNHTNFHSTTNIEHNSLVLKQDNTNWTNDIRKHSTLNSVSPEEHRPSRPIDTHTDHSEGFLTPLKRPNFSSRVTSTPRSESFQVFQSTPNRPTQEVRVEKESPYCSKSKVKRKFPGPAGLLPKLAAGQSLDTNQVLVLNSPLPQKKEPAIVSSQCTEDVFTDPPWQMLQGDLGEECHSILHKFSIRDTVNKAQQKQLPNGKVPLLFGVLDSLDVHGADGSVILRDKTGKMQGTVHRELLRECECQLQQGVVIVLKQVAVISPNQRSHYLNITPSNVISVYRNNGDGTATVSLNDTDRLLSQVETIETQLRETPVSQTPQLGQLLSQPRTPIQSPALFQTPGYNMSTHNYRGQLDSQSSHSLHSSFKHPQSKPGTPQFQPRTPQFNSRTPQKIQQAEPRTPQYQPRTPQFQPRTPQIQPRTPQILPRTPQYQPKTPQSQPRTPQFQPTTLQFQARTLQFQARTPEFQPTTPQYPVGNSAQYRTMQLQQRTPQTGIRTPQLNSQTQQFRDEADNDMFTMTQWEDVELPIPPAVNIGGEDSRSPLQTMQGNIFNETNSAPGTPKQTPKSKWTFKPRNSPNLSVSSQCFSPNLASPGNRKDCIPNKVRSGISSSTSRPDVTFSNNSYLQRRNVSSVVEDSNNNQLRTVQNNTRFNILPPNKVPRMNCSTSIDGQDLNNRLNKRNSDERNNLNVFKNGLQESRHLHMDVDNLWQDDLTDDLLTEFTSDDFP